MLECVQRKAHFTLDISYDLSLGGEAILDDLQTSWNKANEHSTARKILLVAILHILCSYLSQNKLPPQQYDEWIRFDEFDAKDIDEHDFSSQAAPLLYKLIDALPNKRREAIFRKWLQPDFPLFPRVLPALNLKENQKILYQAFTLLSLHIDMVRPPFRTGVGTFLTKMAESQQKKKLLKLMAKIISEHTLVAEFYDILKTVLQEEDCKKLMNLLPASQQKNFKESPLEKIRRLLKHIPSDLKMVTIYFLVKQDAKPASNALNRIGGIPLGFDLTSWPRGGQYEGFMEHIFSIDVGQLPFLQQRPAYCDTKALAFFASHAMEFYEETGENVQLISLDSENLKRQISRKELPDIPFDFMDDESQEKSFAIESLDVPHIIFAENWPGWASKFGGKARRPIEEEDIPVEIRSFNSAQIDRIQDVYDAIYTSPAFAGGAPLWLQFPDMEADDFILQFDERFANINLGDMGIMYIGEKKCFFQCH
ncbi:MAG: hypothetical protein AAF518_21625 [Spirochaetota bacterium]